MGEPVTFKSGMRLDWDGGGSVQDDDRVIVHAVVSPLSESRIDAVDVDGNSQKLMLLVPPQTPVQEGDVATVRGLDYRVVAIPFDWSVGRRPWNVRHKPGKRVIVDRGEA